MHAKTNAREPDMLQAIDPTTGRLVREVAPADAAQVERILAAADGAWRGWRDLGFAKRAQVLRRVAKIMREDVDRLALLMTEEMGKPRKEAVGEVVKAAWAADHYAEHAEAYLAAQQIQSDATRSYVRHEPLGAILGILPWNAPFWLAFRFAAPALMAGNTCVMKHDSHVPGCAAAIAEVFERAQAPAGVFSNLAVRTPQVESVIRDPRIQAVSFTGSERGGGAVASAAAAEIKHAVL